MDSPVLSLTHLGGGHYDIDDILQKLQRPPDVVSDAKADAKTDAKTNAKWVPRADLNIAM